MGTGPLSCMATVTESTVADGRFPDKNKGVEDAFEYCSKGGA